MFSSSVICFDVSGQKIQLWSPCTLLLLFRTININYNLETVLQPGPGAILGCQHSFISHHNWIHTPPSPTSQSEAFIQYRIGMSTSDSLTTLPPGRLMMMDGSRIFMWRHLGDIYNHVSELKPNIVTTPDSAETWLISRVYFYSFGQGN